MDDGSDAVAIPQGRIIFYRIITHRNDQVCGIQELIRRLIGQLSYPPRQSYRASPHRPRRPPGMSRPRANRPSRMKRRAASEVDGLLASCPSNRTGVLAALISLAASAIAALFAGPGPPKPRWCQHPRLGRRRHDVPRQTHKGSTGASRLRNTESIRDDLSDGMRRPYTDTGLRHRPAQGPPNPWSGGFA